MAQALACWQVGSLEEARAAAATGHVAAMAMYAGESVAGISAVEPAAKILRSWCEAAGA